MNALGQCPKCGADGKIREKRPNGNDKCENGHTYPSRDAVFPASSCSSRTVKFRTIDFAECVGECEGCGTQDEPVLKRYGVDYCFGCWEATRGTR
jgi:hypothetical protein